MSSCANDANGSICSPQVLKQAPRSQFQTHATLLSIYGLAGRKAESGAAKMATATPMTSVEKWILWPKMVIENLDDDILSKGFSIWDSLAFCPISGHLILQQSLCIYSTHVFFFFLFLLTVSSFCYSLSDSILNFSFTPCFFFSSKANLS